MALSIFGFPAGDEDQPVRGASYEPIDTVPVFNGAERFSLFVLVTYVFSF